MNAQHAALAVPPLPVPGGRFGDLSLYRKARRLAGIAMRALLHRTPLDFDHVHRVDTWGSAGLPSLRRPMFDAGGRARYEPCSVRQFHFAMELVPRPHEAWSLLDVGSGKGRAVLLAMGYPFRRVVGVELDPALHAVAQRNVQRYRGPRRSATVELRCEDATRTPLPPGDVVLFLFNPFAGALLERLLDHLEASVREELRRLLFLYSNPVHRALLEARPAFRTVFDGQSPPDPLWRDMRRLAAYALGPGA